MMFTYALGLLQVVLSWAQVLHGWIQARSSYIMSQVSYIWHLRLVTSDRDAPSMIATHSHKCLFMHQLSYMQLECNKYLHDSVTRYTTPGLRLCHSFISRSVKCELKQNNLEIWLTTKNQLQIQIKVT